MGALGLGCRVQGVGVSGLLVRPVGPAEMLTATLGCVCSPRPSISTTCSTRSKVGALLIPTVTICARAAALRLDPPLTASPASGNLHHQSCLSARFGWVSVLLCCGCVVSGERTWKSVQRAVFARATCGLVRGAVRLGLLTGRRAVCGHEERHESVMHRHV
eukprot:2988362-Rhodomonas_salina.1